MSEQMHAERCRVSVEAATVWSRPDAARKIDDPVLRDEPDLREWVDGMGVPERRGLRGRVVTQGIFGEWVDVIGETGGWRQVIMREQASRLSSRGYPGWVRSSHVEAAHPVPPEGRVVPLPPRVTLPRISGGRVSGEDIVRISRSLMGVPYLWGGMTGYGFDCSGLVSTVYRNCGMVIPRDANDQALCGRVVAESELQCGDLVFFDNGVEIHHVGMATGRSTMIHAPRTGAFVEEYPIDGPAYSGDRILARRLLSGLFISRAAGKDLPSHSRDRALPGPVDPEPAIHSPRSLR